MHKTEHQEFERNGCNLLWLDNYFLCRPFRVGGSQAEVWESLTVLRPALKTHAEEVVYSTAPAIVNVLLCYYNSSKWSSSDLKTTLILNSRQNL